MKPRAPIYAYRLRYPDSPNAPEKLWKWDRLHIDRLRWHALTFGRDGCAVLLCRLERARTCKPAYLGDRLSATDAVCALAYLAGMARRVPDARATTQEVYEPQYGEKREDPNVEPELSEEQHVVNPITRLWHWYKRAAHRTPSPQGP